MRGLYCTYVSSTTGKNYTYSYSFSFFGIVKLQSTGKGGVDIDLRLPQDKEQKFGGLLFQRACAFLTHT